MIGEGIVNEKHVLHKEIGSLLCQSTLPEGCKLILDQACGKIIVDPVALPVNSKKRDQFLNIEESIGKILPIAGSNIHKYKLICTESSKLQEDKESLLNPILDYLR
jgi:hypothetical protein